MAITQNLKSYDSWFNVISSQKVIINDLDYLSMDDMEAINRQLITTYNSDIMSTVPSCDCGVVKGRFKLHAHCSECGTTCREVHQKVEPLLWMRKLQDGLEFINPTFWLMMRQAMDKKIDCMRWMSDYKYNPPGELPTFLHGVKDILVERNYNNMIDKLPEVIHYMLNHAKFKDIDKQDDLNMLLEMYIHQKHNIFNNFMPIINKKLFVMENTTKGKFISLAVSDVIDVVMSWIQLNSNTEKRTYAKDGIQTAMVISKLATLYYNYFEKYVTKKPGLFRKHVYGARSHFTFRSVITSIPGKHKYDEIWVPWAIGVTAFRPHLLNKLVNQHKIPFKKASMMLFDAVKRYIPLIDQLLNELIAEAPDQKIPILMQRNPSLLASSAILTNIGKFKCDVADLTVSISVLVAKNMNADLSILLNHRSVM